MMIAGFLNFILFSSACSIFCALFLRRGPERYLLPGAILNCLILYVFAAYHHTEAGFKLIYWGNILLYIPVLYKVIRDGWKKSAVKVMTPGFAFYIFASAITFILAADKQFADWDAVSHWGFAVKLFLQDGVLNCEYPSEILLHASYPPGTALMAGMIHSTISCQFSEGITVFAFQVINISILALLFHLVSWKQYRLWMSIALTAAFVLAFWPFGFCYADVPMALACGAAFFWMMSIDCREKTTVLAWGLVTAYLFMFRNAGWGYAVVCVAGMFCRVIYERRYIFKRTGAKIILVYASIIIALLLPFAVKKSWSFLLEHYHTDIRFGGEICNIAAIGNIFEAGTREHDICREFLTNGIWYWLLLLLMFIAGCYAYRICRDKFTAFRLRTVLLGGAVCGVIYSVILLICYIAVFGDNALIPSFDRYMRTFFAVPAMMLLLLYFSLARRRRGGGKHPYVFCALWLIALAAVIFYGSRNFELEGNYAEWRSECDNISEYGEFIRSKDIVFTGVSGSGYGYKSFYYAFLFPEHFRKVNAWHPDYVMPEDISPLVFEQNISGFDHIYFDSLPEDFLLRYGGLFAEEHKEQPAGLYYRDENGRLKKVILP